MDKPTMKYSVVTGKKPGTTEVVMRPLIVDRTTYKIASVVEYAINSGYVRGKADEITGLVRGFFRACKELVDSAFAVNLADWIRIHPELTGSLDETRTLSETRNGLKVNITPLSEMKDLSISDFTWTSTEDTGTRVKINSALTPGGEVGQWKKSGKLMLVGKNLQFKSSLGDKFEISYDGLESPIAIVPTEQDEVHQLYDWPDELAEVELGTYLTCKLTSRGGIEGAPDQVNTTIVKLVAAA